MNETEFRDLLRTLSAGTSSLSKVLPGAAGTVGGIIGAGLALAADLVAAGEDPIESITRIRECAPLLADVEKSWESAMVAKFGPREDIYED